jgi:hypothetical protein
MMPAAIYLMALFLGLIAALTHVWVLAAIATLAACATLVYASRQRGAHPRVRRSPRSQTVAARAAGVT